MWLAAECRKRDVQGYEASLVRQPIASYSLLGLILVPLTLAASLAALLLFAPHGF
jgi:hypothetical protein